MNKAAIICEKTLQRTSNKKRAGREKHGTGQKRSHWLRHSRFRRTLGDIFCCSESG